MRIPALLAFALVAAGLAPGFAASPDLQPALERARTERLVEMLAKQRDADSLAAAGLLSMHSTPEQSLNFFSQATRIAPERADLLWLHVQSCLQDTSCDPEPLEKKLRRLDEHNGAAWFATLARAMKDGDEGARTDALAAIARSRHVDTYWTTLIARLAPPVASVNGAQQRDAVVEVIGVLAAMAVPAYAGLSNACRSERLQLEDVVEVCRGIASALLNGDTIITEMSGISLAQRVWPENSPKWLEAAEAKRVQEYRRQYTKPKEEWLFARPEAIPTLYGQHRREQDVDKAILIEIGKDPDPPASR